MTAMDDGARIWMLRTARKHYWRVAGWYDLDDLIQDGFLCYARVIAKYERRDYITRTGVVTKKSPRVRSRRHIMELFKISYLGDINDLARKRTTNLVEVLAHDIVPEANITDTIWDELVTVDCDINYYERLIAEAPQAVQRLLRILLNDGCDLRFSSAYRVLRTGRETMNERLCKMAGLDPQRIDVATLLRRYLHNEPLAV